MIGTIISLSSFFSMQGYFCYITQRLSRRSKVDLYSLNLRFGDSVHIGDVSWTHIAFQISMQIFQVLFQGCPLFEELLFSLFSIMWISGDLSCHLWFIYVEMAVGLLAVSILISRSILFCIFSIK